MPSIELLALLNIIPAAFVAVVVIVIIKTMSSGSASPLPADPGAVVELHGHVTPIARGSRLRSQFDPATYGRIRLDHTHLYWEPDQGEWWAVAVPAITVLRVTGAVSLTGPHLEISIDGSGPWRLVVSDRTINRFMGNDAKTFREARRAREFAGALLARGARRA